MDLGDREYSAREKPSNSAMNPIQEGNAKIGIVIVNWNHPDDTLRCLASIQPSTYTNYTIVVVDNGSTDDSIKILSKHELLHNQSCVEFYPVVENIGFTGGYNLGIQRLLEQSVDYIFLLNDDSVVDANTLAELANATAHHPEAGFFGPMLYTLEPPQVILSAGGFLDKDFRASHRGIGELDSGQYDQETEVDYLFGCALLVSRRLIETIGLLDEKFFAYHEEVDWCFRGKQAGFQALLIPRAHAWHPDTRHRDKDSAKVTYYISRNSLLFVKKNRLGLPVLAKMVFTYCRQLLSWTLRPKWRGKAKQRLAMQHALWDFAWGNFGKWDLKT